MVLFRHFRPNPLGIPFRVAAKQIEIPKGRQADKINFWQSSFRQGNPFYVPYVVLPPCRGPIKACSVPGPRRGRKSGAWPRCFGLPPSSFPGTFNKQPKRGLSAETQPGTLTWGKAGRAPALVVCAYFIPQRPLTREKFGISPRPVGTGFKDTHCWPSSKLAQLLWSGQERATS